MVKHMLNHKAKHYSPAYYKYRQKHATISVLLSKKTKEALDKARGDKSYSQFIKSLFAENGLFFELQKQNAEIQKLRSEVIRQKKELETKRRNFEQEMADFRHRTLVEIQNARDQFYKEKASYIKTLEDEARQSGYLEGEKVGFSKGILKGKEQGRQFYLSFCTLCGESIFWDLNKPEDIKCLEGLMSQSQLKLGHIACQEAQKGKAYDIKYLGSTEFIPR